MAALVMAADLSFLAILVDAALSDFRRFRIPNRDSGLLVVVFAVAAAASGASPPDFLMHLAAAVALLAAGALLFGLGVWGGGDAKLLAAVGAWTGFSGLPRLLLVMALVGGALALAVIILRRLPPVKGDRPRLFGQRFATTGHVPYGIAIAAGAVDWWGSAILPQMAGYLAS